MTGLVSKFEVFAKDQKTEVGSLDRIIVTVEPADARRIMSSNKIECVVDARSFLQASCSYKLTISGNYFLIIKGIGLLVASSSFNLSVMPSFIYRDTDFTRNQNQLKFVTAGVVQNIQVRVKDIWWNTLEQMSRIIAFVRSDSIAGVKRDEACSISNPNEDNSINVSLELTSSGVYALILKSVAGIGLTATYFADSIFLYPEVSRVESTVDFSRAPSESLFSGLSLTSSFGVRWSSLVRPRFAGNSTFFLRSLSSTERFRMWIDNSLVIDQWSSLNSTLCKGTISFPLANIYYDLLVEYKQLNSSQASLLQLLWKGHANVSLVSSNRLAIAHGFSSGPYLVTVSPSSLCSSTSFLSGMNQTTWTVGQLVSFTIFTRDSFANPTNLPPKSSIALYAGDLQLSPVSFMVDVGEWKMQLILTVSGIFAIQARAVNVPFLQATYYSDISLDVPVLSRTEQTIDFDWHLLGPINPYYDFFSSKWIGKICVNATGYYSFLLLADDCATFDLAGRRILDSCSANLGVQCLDCVSYPAQGLRTNFFLQAEKLYEFELRHYESTGSSLCRLLISFGSNIPQAVGDGLVFSDQTFSSGLSISVWSDKVEKDGCLLSPSLFTIATSGIVSSFGLVCRDSYGNLFTTFTASAAVLFGVLRAPRIRDVPLTWIYEGDGRFSASFVPLIPGKYQVQISTLIPGIQGLAATYYDALNSFRYSSTGRHILSEHLVLTLLGSDVLNYGLFSTSDFRIRWSGLLLSSVSGEYSFVVRKNTGDRVKLWVDNQLIIDCWSSPVSYNLSGVFSMNTDTLYRIELEFGKSSPGGFIDLQWQFLDNPLTTIPSNNFLGIEEAVSSFDEWIQVMVGDVCSMRSTASGTGLTVSTAFSPALFTIRSRDAAGNMVTAPDQDLVVRIETAAESRFLFIRDVNGIFVVNYTLESQNQYWIHATFLKQGGLIASYYSNGSWSSPEHFNFDEDIDFSSSLFASSTTLFQVRWSGYLRPSFFEDYMLYASLLVSSDRVRLWVDNCLLVDQWSSLAATTSSASIIFPASKSYYYIQIEYKHTVILSPSGLSLAWSSASAEPVTKVIIPSSSFYVPSEIMDSPFPAKCEQCIDCICAVMSLAKGSALSIMTAGSLTSFRIHLKDSTDSQPRLTVQPIYASVHGPLSTAHTSDSSTLALPVMCNGGLCITEDRNSQGWMVTRSGEYMVSIVTVHSGGIWATYYQSQHFYGSISTQLSQQVALRENGATLSAKWLGFVIPKVSELFTFHSRLTCENSYAAVQHLLIYVDSKIVFENWELCSRIKISDVSATVPLSAGALYEISVMYQRSDFNSNVELTWSSISTPRSPIGNFFFPRDQVSGSPFSSITVPGPPCASTTTVLHSAISIITAGFPSTFSIHLRDEFGNSDLRGIGSISVFSATPGCRNSHATIFFADPYASASLVLNKAGQTEVYGVLAGSQGLAATYFLTDEFSTPLYTRVDFNIDFSSQLPCSEFYQCGVSSIRWTGLLLPQASEVSARRVTCIL